MCGIVAMVTLDGRPADRGVVERMSRAIPHRGPDDSGDFYSGPIGFGFRRLAILDLSALGHQPMSSGDGMHTIVFNGEIYNYRELRAELQALGQEFHSSGDTEVLLCAYRQWGRDCVSRLYGMWAFLIYDKAAGCVFGARDRFGIKPLYCLRTATEVLFGSEIKAIRASGLCRKQTNWAIASGFLLRGTLDEGSETFLDDVRQIGAATAFELSPDGAYRQWKFWSVESDVQEPSPDPAARFAELFEDSMRLHMRSDVPVCIHLSGGLDSTSIICAAARIREQEEPAGELMAFSYMAEEYDESRYIADTIAQTEARLVSLRSDPVGFWNNLREVLWYTDEPFHSIYLLVAYELMRMTSRHGVKVVLNGQGADETLAGYPSYFKDYWNTLLLRGRFVDAWREIGRFTSAHGGSAGGILVRQLKHCLLSRLYSTDGYRRLAGWNECRRARANPWFTPELKRMLPDTAAEVRGWDLAGALSRSIERTPLPLYLRIEDRISMAHSIESRVPFLDHRLVSFAFHLPADWKMRGAFNKFILREAMRGRIPESVRTRPEKFGFPIPAKKWLASSLFEPACDVVTSRTVRERGIYRTDRILQDLTRYRRGEIDVTVPLFNVLQFELWSELVREDQAPRRTAGEYAAG